MYRFYSNPTDSNRVTVVGEHRNGVLNMSVAITGKSDQFMRKKGRAIAEGRLAKGKFAETVEMAECTSQQFHERAIALAEKVSETKKPYLENNVDEDFADTEENLQNAGAH